MRSDGAKPPAGRPIRELPFKIVALVLGTLAAFLVLEVALRFRALATERSPEADLARTRTAAPPPFRGDCRTQVRQAQLGEIVRPSPANDLVYDLKPNIDTCFYRARTQTNANGQRGRTTFARPKPPNTFRIVLLGDSVTFGQGVPYEDTFGAVLERLLGEAAPDVHVEVINTGVPGYNTAQEAAYLESKGITYEPDCVMMLFIGNDMGLPHLMLDARDPMTLRESYVASALGRWFRGRKQSAETSAWFRVANGPDAEFVHDDDVSRVPERYRHMVGISGYKRALQSIMHAVEPSHIPVVDVADWKPVPTTLDQDDLNEFHRNIGMIHADIEYPPTQEFWVAPDDEHLNARGNARLAKDIMDELKWSGVCLPGNAR